MAGRLTSQCAGVARYPVETAPRGLRSFQAVGHDIWQRSFAESLAGEMANVQAQGRGVTYFGSLSILLQHMLNLYV